MPTGYTAAIADGINFSQFAMSCARAFGALVTMRDEPADAPIPEEFAPSTWDADQIEKDRDEISRLRSLTPEEVHAESCTEYQDALEKHQSYVAKKRALRVSYEAMLSKVQAWEPPTLEHAGLKEFMAQQLTDSIKFDCNENYDTVPACKPASVWLSDRIAAREKSIGYHIKQQAEESDRAAKRTEWVKALRASLQGAA